jgi:hypothetical protein
MKKLLVLMFGWVMIQMVSWSQCNGVQLKPGAESYKKYTNGCQVVFDFCGKEATLLKHQGLLTEVYPQAQFAYTAIATDQYACTLTIPQVEAKDYAVKIMMSMGFQVVTKGDKKLTGDEAQIWFN